MLEAPVPEDLVKGYQELVAARPAYERAAAFYEGTVEEVYASQKVTRLLSKFGLDAIDSFNFAHIPVDAIANKLHINAVTVDDGTDPLNSQTLSQKAAKDTAQKQKQFTSTQMKDNSTPGGSGDKPDAPAQKVGNVELKKPGPNFARPRDDLGQKSNPINQIIEDLWEYNELGEELPNLHRNIGKYGDYYMLVWPIVGNEDNAGNKAFDVKKSAAALSGKAEASDEQADAVEDDLAQAANKTIVAVDMICHDPLTTRAFYDTENPRKMSYVIRSWEEGEGQNVTVRANLYYPDRIERWVHKGRPPKRKSTKTRWLPYVEDGSAAVLPNPFDQIPFFHYRTDRTYGKPDHIYAYGPQLAINKLVTSHLATVDYQSFPQRYALTDPMADNGSIQGTDSDPFAPEDDEGVEDDNLSQLESDPSVVWKLEGIKTVGEFKPADAKAYLDPFDRYVKAMSQVTGIPLHFFDKTGERPPSGENIRQVNEQMNSKVETRQLGVGATHRNAFTFALNLLGHEVERVKVTWRPIEVVTDLAGWQAINEKQLAGVPAEVTLIEAGYLPEEVAPWKDEWDREAIEAQKIEQQQLEIAQTGMSTSNTVRYTGARKAARDGVTSNGTPKPTAGGGTVKPNPKGKQPTK
jgi:hypothetical protein